MLPDRVGKSNLVLVQPSSTRRFTLSYLIHILVFALYSERVKRGSVNRSQTCKQHVRGGGAHGDTYTPSVAVHQTLLLAVATRIRKRYDVRSRDLPHVVVRTSSDVPPNGPVIASSHRCRCPFTLAHSRPLPPALLSL